MHLEVKCHKNGRNKMFRGKQPPNEVSLLFFNVEMLMER